MARELNVDAINHLLVLVPHQDDEILIGAGLIYELLQRNKKVTVAIATNGDCGCSDKTKGQARLRETVAGLGVLGVSQNDIVFLGYADTGMEREKSFLLRLYQSADANKIYSSSVSSVTYALKEKSDFHWQQFGIHGTYTKSTFVADLHALLEITQPDCVLTTHSADLHGDHEGLFYFVRDALAELPDDKKPELLVGLVHSPEGDGTWPKRNTLFYTCPKGLGEKGLLWDERLVLPLRRELCGGKKEKNLKYQALRQYPIALEPNVVEYLLSYVKDEEIFWSIAERYGHSNANE